MSYIGKTKSPHKYHLLDISVGKELVEALEKGHSGTIEKLIRAGKVRFID